MCKITTSLLYLFCLLYARPNWLHRQKKYDKMGAHSKITGQKYLPVGINAESWTENMGISHEYHSAPRRRTRGGISGKLRLAGVIVAILLVAYAVTAILEKGTAEEESTPQTIKKAVRDLISISKEVAQKDLQFEKDPESMSAKELEKLIGEVQKKMKKAAAELDFETAAMLRDQMIGLKKQLQEIS